MTTLTEVCASESPINDVTSWRMMSLRKCLLLGFLKCIIIASHIVINKHNNNHLHIKICTLLDYCRK